MEFQFYMANKLARSSVTEGSNVTRPGATILTQPQRFGIADDLHAVHPGSGEDFTASKSGYTTFTVRV